MLFKTLNGTYKLARRIVIAIVGFSVVIVGVIMIFTPGPAVVVIPAGLAILGLEFAFARRWLTQFKEKSMEAVDSLRNKGSTEDEVGKDAGPQAPAQQDDAAAGASVEAPKEATKDDAQSSG